MAHGAANHAVLLALLTSRARGESVAALVAEIMQDGIASTWASRHPEDLLGGREEGLIEDAGTQIRLWAERGLKFVSIVDDDYPRRLSSVHDAPPFLFYRGDLRVLQSGGISVVGSREASEEGLLRAEDAACHLVERGITVISGLARGIDSAAHRAALRIGGTTLGVIATGIAAPYAPASSRDLHEDVAAAGALVSQFLPDAHAMRHTFLLRNATMSGLGFATLVIEAGENSGARAQARLAMEHGRPVILSDRVVEQTKWGRALADGRRANVFVVSSRDDLHAAVSRVTEQTSLEQLDHLLAASR